MDEVLLLAQEEAVPMQGTKSIFSFNPGACLMSVILLLRQAGNLGPFPFYLSILPLSLSPSLPPLLLFYSLDDQGRLSGVLFLLLLILISFSMCHASPFF